MQEQHILFVPGKNPKPDAISHHRLLWQVLHEGIKRTSPEALQQLESIKDHFHIAAWNPIFYHTYKNIEHEQPWIDVLLDTYEPSRNDKREANHIHKKFTRSVYNLADLAPILISWFGSEAIKSTVKETERYFLNHNNVASEIREVLKQQLRPLLQRNARILLIGHSLGSVIAYDSLWELSHIERLPGKVDTFLTLGSPLGMRFIQHRLLGRRFKERGRYPLNIQKWVNISSEGDLVAVDRRFRDDFQEMIQLGLVDDIEDHCEDIYNFYRNEEGLNCHRSYGYLINPVVDKVISRWLLKS
jgi:hypothetical protein